MEHLYHRHFGFSEAAFNITPDPSFLYFSPTHREALAQLRYGIAARRGFIVLTGEVGTGKTTLIQTLLGQIADQRTQTALVFSWIANSLDLMRYVCEEFRLTEPLQPVRDLHDYTSLINEFLLRGYRNGENAVLIIDEAQNLPLEVLESIRLLSNFETTKTKLLQILLVGQPELSERLNAPQLRQLKQRVTLRHNLRPLSLTECHEYIVSRLKQASGDPGLFTPKAIETIFSYSGGIPRLINVICDNSMINAYALDQRQIDPPLIHEVASDLHLAEAPLRPGSPRVNVQGAANTERPKPQPVQFIKGRAEVSTGHLTAVSNNGSVPQEVFVWLREGLLDAMGPMAHVVLSEHVKLLGESFNGFPKDKMIQLIESVSTEIFDHSIRKQFRQSMSTKMNSL